MNTPHSTLVENVYTGFDLALNPVPPLVSPGTKYAEAARKWQGIPGIEHAKNGRLWAAWYTGGRTEDEHNHVVLVNSGDGGDSWSEPVLAIDPPGEVRASDPVLWMDPLGRLWLFWMQTAHCGTTFDGRAGVWAIIAEDPGQANPTWSEPLRLANGIMMNKPTVLSTGEWVFPCAVWSHHKKPSRFWLPNETFSNVILSDDQGETFRLLGSADVPNRACDEHMIVENSDGRLWMAVRCNDGIRRAYSSDQGKTWEAEEELYLPGPTSRFHLRKLSSGRLLLIYNDHPSTRTNLTAFLSEDEGITWPYRLLLDGREMVSYPDATETPSGEILVTYDFKRTGEGEILLQRFTESEILSKNPGSVGDRQRICISRLHRKPLPTGPVDFSEKSLVDQVRNLSIVIDESKGPACWTSLRAGETEGEVAMPPFIMSGGTFRLFGEIASQGFIKVELENCSGNPIKGFCRKESISWDTGESALCVDWQNGADLETLAGQLIRIRFVLKHATLKGFHFFPSSNGDALAPITPSEFEVANPGVEELIAQR